MWTFLLVHGAQSMTNHFSSYCFLITNIKCGGEALLKNTVVALRRARRRRIVVLNRVIRTLIVI